MSSQQGRHAELTVIVKAKDLATYVFEATEVSPKRFRFSLVARLQGYAINVIECLYRANDTYVAEGDIEALNRRRSLQQQALTELKLLGYVAELSMERGCLLLRQYERIAKLVHDCQCMLGAWITSDKKRFG